jgi:hypothetical protein
MKFREKTEIKTARFFENLIYFYFVFPVLGVTLCSLVVSDRFWIRRMLSEDPAALHTLRHPIIANNILGKAEKTVVRTSQPRAITFALIARA